MNYNAFEHSAADEIEEALNLSKKCEATVIFRGATITCEVGHMRGGFAKLEHKAVVEDDLNGRVLHITWM